MPISEYLRKLREQVGHERLIVPVALGLVFNEAGEILLQRRSDDGLWGIPGGAMDPGEEPGQCVVREVYEETGLTVMPEYIVGVWSGDFLYHTYPNGDQVAPLSIVFRCRPVGGELRPLDDESLEVRYFGPDALPDALPERHRVRIRQALKNDSMAYFVPPED